MSTTLRTATPEDLALILGFIRDLATYEKLLDQVVADAPSLQAALFGAHPQAEVVIAERDGSAAGFALYFHNFSTFRGRRGLYLEDLFVRPEHRGAGIGKALLAHLAKLAIERGCARFEWAVLDWNAPAIGFYQSLGAHVLDDWRVCRLDGEALARLAASAD
ncbi:MAG: GNAT family N-acetyltransferase [Xanthomonadales bacterium]|nr:GNAT family N-acetyltransferase [Xanthomonadales bacterium]MBK7146429.1 GNAT family N-acetyltransferase [Xanthomonadales bacterium]MCC6562637.1 GNAT family N-acetyltransferase [Xanthomonadales bacterium]